MAAEEPGPPVSVLVASGNELHEDEAALRLAKAIAGSGLDVRGPNQSRLDLVAAVDGVVTVRIADLERINRLDPLEVFTVYDGQVVERGDLVASVKVAPHLVDAGVIEAGARIAGFGSQPIVSVAPFVARRVGVVVKESVRATAKERFEASVRAKVEGLGSEILDIVYVEDDADAVETAVGRFTRGAETADLVLTAGSASTDPEDAFFIAIEALGGRVVRRGVPSHPGSMLWLARVGGTSILGLPTCGAYSKATAADLLLPRLLAGEPAVRSDRGEAGPRRDPDAGPALPISAVRARAGCAGRVGGTAVGEADIAKAIAEARSYLTANPTEARYRDGAATASIEDGLRVRVVRRRRRLTRDGHGHRASAVVASAPSPGWMFRAAYASCVATLIAMRGAQEGWSLSGLEVAVDSESDDRGILGIDQSVPAGPLSIRVAVSASAGGVDASSVRAAIEDAVAKCPVHDAVVRAVPVDVDVQVR